MKKNRVLRLGLLALALTLVTASLVSGTFAKYVTTVDGTGVVQVAHWQVEVGPNSTYTAGTEIPAAAGAFNLLNTVEANDDVSTGTTYKLIAPGTKGSFSLAYSTLGSQVDHTIVVKLSNTGENSISDLQYLTFTLPDGTEKTAAQMAVLSGVEIYNEKILAGGRTGDMTVSWVWPIGPDGLTALQNTNDTADGMAQKTYEFTATFTAVQTNIDPE